MKIIKKITKLTALTLITSFGIAAGANAWGPERQTFTMEEPATYPTFNSITNNPTIGDERDFVRVAEINADVTALSNEVEVVPGKQYLVYIYYHNNAASMYNNPEYNNVGIAAKSRVSTIFPNVLTPEEKGTVSATITAENSNPLSVWDEAYFTTKAEKIFLSYVAGSAKIYNDWGANNSILSTSIFTEDGALLGVNHLNGIVPGCEEYHGVVSYVVEAKQFSGSLEKTAEKTELLPGEEVEFTLTIKNTGDIGLTNTIIDDVLPDGLTLVPGSVRLIANDSTTEDQLSDNLVSGGYNLGRVGTGNTVYIKYRVKVGDDFDCTKKVQNTATLTYDSETTQGDSKTAAVELTVKQGEECKEAPVPEPNTPDKIVETGPLEIVLAAIIILAILGAGFYFWRTRRSLKHVEDKVSGKETSDKEANSQEVAGKEIDDQAAKEAEKINEDSSQKE